jgi:hypothetical protein
VRATPGAVDGRPVNKGQKPGAPGDHQPAAWPGPWA